MKSADGSACLPTDVFNVPIWETNQNFCHDWVPELLAPGPGLAAGYRIRSGIDYDLCLQGTSLGPCNSASASQRFEDRQIGLTSFLMVQNGGNQCLARTAGDAVQLSVCNAADPAQQWTDPPSTTTTTTTIRPKKRAPALVLPPPPGALTSPGPPPVIPPLHRGTLPPGATPYYVVGGGAAVSVFVAGAMYAYWEYKHLPSGDDFEWNFGSVENRNKGINRFRLLPGKTCKDVVPIQFKHF